MKKTISMLLALAFLAVVPGSAFAGGRGYYGHGGFGAGAFFAGLLGGAILGSVIANSRPAYAYEPPRQIWVPGHYAARYERQWVPGYWTREENPAYGDDDDGNYRGARAWVPGHYEDARVEVWLPGHWEYGG